MRKMKMKKKVTPHEDNLVAVREKMVNCIMQTALAMVGNLEILCSQETQAFS